MPQAKNYEPFFSWRSAILTSELPATTRHVLLTLSCHMNDAGESCFPSIERLSKETGLSTRAVSKHLGAAREACWIKTEKHGFAGRQWARNEYRISWPPHLIGGGDPGSIPCHGAPTSAGGQQSVAGGEPGSAGGASGTAEAANLETGGMERSDREAGNQGQTISSVNSSSNSSGAKTISTPEIANQHIQLMKQRLRGGHPVEELFAPSEQFPGEQPAADVEVAGVQEFQTAEEFHNWTPMEEPTP
jgi:hypothetical protein